MKYQLGFLLLILSASVKAQVVVDEMKHPIPYVDVVVSGSLSTFWQTDFNGKIPEKTLKTITANDTVIFHHISYKERRITGADLKGIDTIYLLPIVYNLREIALSSKTPKYQKMTACFRSLVIQDNRPLYYSEGKVDYLTKVKNINYKLFCDTLRSFEHKNLANYEMHYNVETGWFSAYTPSPKKKYLPSYMVKKHDLLLMKTESGTTHILTKDSLQIGVIKENRNLLEYKINNIFVLKERKALNTEVSTIGFYIQMVFSKPYSENKKLAENFDDLLYYKIQENYTIKHDKDMEKRYVDCTIEMFVEDVSFLEEEDKEYSNKRGMHMYSKYESEFWNECDCELYYPQNLKLFEDMRML